VLTISYRFGTPPQSCRKLAKFFHRSINHLHLSFRLLVVRNTELYFCYIELALSVVVKYKNVARNWRILIAKMLKKMAMRVTLQQCDNSKPYLENWKLEWLEKCNVRTPRYMYNNRPSLEDECFSPQLDWHDVRETWYNVFSVTTNGTRFHWTLVCFISYSS